MCSVVVLDALDTAPSSILIEESRPLTHLVLCRLDDVGKAMGLLSVRPCPIDVAFVWAQRTAVDNKFLADVAEQVRDSSCPPCARKALHDAVYYGWAVNGGRDDVPHPNGAIVLRADFNGGAPRTGGQTPAVNSLVVAVTPDEAKAEIRRRLALVYPNEQRMWVDGQQWEAF